MKAVAPAESSRSLTESHEGCDEPFRSLPVLPLLTRVEKGAHGWASFIGMIPILRTYVITKQRV